MDLWEDWQIYKTYQRTVSQNPKLDRNNAFFAFIERIYVSHMLVALRTFDDRDLRSHSLYNLINELLTNNQHVTRDWFFRRYRRQLRHIVEPRFQSDWGSGGFLSKRKLLGDRRLLTNSCRQIRQVVNKYIAHTARRRRRVALNYEEIDQAFDDICQLVKRYNLLLFRLDWHPSSTPDWTAVFDIAWKSCRDGVAKDQPPAAQSPVP